MRILYEPLTPEDGAEFFALAGDPRAAASMRFACPRTRQESDRILADYLAGENRAFALRFRPGEPLWGIFAFRCEPGADTASLSQMLAPEQWGRGLGGQVLREMTALARREGRYRALEGYILEHNIASRRMAASAGFREERRLRFPGMTEDLVVCRLEL